MKTNTTLACIANIDPRITALVGRVNHELRSAALSHAQDAEAAALKGDWSRADAILKLADDAHSRIFGTPVKFVTGHQMVNKAKWASLAKKRLPK